MSRGGGGCLTAAEVCSALLLCLSSWFNLCHPISLSDCFSHAAVAVLLSNVSLLELLQKVLEYTWLRSPPSEPAYLSSEDALLCSGWLLVASLLFYQHRYNTEVRTTVVFRSRQWLNLKKEKLKKKKKSSLAKWFALAWNLLALVALLLLSTSYSLLHFSSRTGS